MIIIHACISMVRMTETKDIWQNIWLIASYKVCTKLVPRISEAVLLGIVWPRLYFKTWISLPNMYVYNTSGNLCLYSIDT